MKPGRIGIETATTLVWLILSFSASGCDPDQPAAEAVAEWHLPAMTAPSDISFEEGIEAWFVIRVVGEAGNSWPDLPGDDRETPTVESLAEALQLAVETQDQPVRIEIAPGKHDALGAVESVRRTKHTPIVIAGALDEQGRRLTLVDGGADGIEDAGEPCIRMSNVSFIVIANILCERAFPHGMNIDDGSDYSTPTHHITIRNVLIRDVGLYQRTKIGTNSDCLKLSGVDDFRVLNSEFENCVSGEFIDMVGSHRGLITGNHFHNKPLNGVQTKGGSSDVLITGNVFEGVEGRSIQLGGDTGEPYYRPIDAAYPAQQIRVVANIIRTNPEQETQNDAFSLNGCRDCLIAHNTVTDIGRRSSILYIDREEAERPGNSRIVLANNVYLVTEQDADSAILRLSQRGRIGSDELKFDHEVYAGISRDAWLAQTSVLKLPSDRFNGIRWLDPELDRQGRPRNGSPLIGTGTSRYRYLTPTDFEKSPISAKPSVGAYNQPPN